MLPHSVWSYLNSEEKKTSIILLWVPPTSVLCSPFNNFLFTQLSHFVAYDCASSCSPFLSLTWHILLSLLQTLVVASTSFSSSSLSTSFSVMCTSPPPPGLPILRARHPGHGLSQVHNNVVKWAPSLLVLHLCIYTGDLLTKGNRNLKEPSWESDRFQQK